MLLQEKRHISQNGKGESPSGELPFDPQKKTVTTVTTVTELAREPDFLHVILCLAEVSVLFVIHDVLSVHPDTQSRLAVALLAAAEPHGAVLLTGEAACSCRSFFGIVA